VPLLKQAFQAGRLNFKTFKQLGISLIKDRNIRGFLEDYIKILVKYLKPGFHPKQIDDQYLLNLHRPEVQQYS
jgi:predicted metal-dependent hydrolase